MECHSALLNDIPSRANNNSGNVIFFKIPGYQTHGLVTDGSKGRKYQGINAILFAKLKNLGSRFL